MIRLSAYRLGLWAVFGPFLGAGVFRHCPYDLPRPPVFTP